MIGQNLSNARIFFEHSYDSKPDEQQRGPDLRVSAIATSDSRDLTYWRL